LQRSEEMIDSVNLVLNFFEVLAGLATIVLGSQGITFTPVAVPSVRSPELKIRVIRDGLRSMLWLVSGRTGASLGDRFDDSES
ncbi:MAG: hypothetical protein HC895_24025, partial [Leptolyngbyaceae cyanobacterium SM1_3_5]|nr:hypothetical protein [Leptolyngbyaceae cyanobacterium SM1_3_5]